MKLLIVDDDPATVMFMRLAFAAAGYAVTTASSVDEAIAQVRHEAPDVVLSDLAFGSPLGADHDGCSLARTLRSMPATAGVGLLAVTGAGTPDVLLEIVESGFDGFVSKPVDLASLLDRVDRLAHLVAVRRVDGSAMGEGTRDQT